METARDTPSREATTLTLRQRLLPALLRYQNQGWRWSCPFASRVDPRDENDAIKVFRTRDGEYHTARAAVYRPLAAILIAAFGQNPDGEPKRPSPIQWCAFASVESASTTRVDTELHGRYYHGDVNKLGSTPNGNYRTPSNGKDCDRSSRCKWESSSDWNIVQGLGSRIYAVGTHKVTSGKYSATARTAGGFNADHSSGKYQRPPRR